MNNPWHEISPPKDDISARLIDYAHPLGLYWARDHFGKYLFICETDENGKVKKTDIPELAGIVADFITLNGKTRLVLMLNEQSNWEIFHALCTDIVEATRKIEGSSAAFTIILRRLNRWHDFLKKIKADILPEEQIKGLIGELLFIRNHLAPVYGYVDAVNFWVGPEDAPQDFNVNDAAVEVKCQGGTTQPYVKISSVEQLSPQLPYMFLYVVTLGKTTADHQDAVNLPMLVKLIRNELELASSQQAERFSDLLFGLGYVDSQKYQNFNYILTEEIMFEVKDEFPRIDAGTIHEGITKLRYNISLSECLPYEKWPVWLEKN
ncbi:PD-(D/E)XK motif protein [Pontiellaceae bacterium B12219]|nr:PD-(D/E)XK motif protein [Pontiellaceae bacterium B12219]